MAFNPLEEKGMPLESQLRDPEAILPEPAFTEPLQFQSNKAYVRKVLATQDDVRGLDGCSTRRVCRYCGIGM